MLISHLNQIHHLKILKVFKGSIQFNSIQFYITNTEYYEHKVRLILQYYLTKIEEEGKNKFDNMLL